MLQYSASYHLRLSLPPGRPPSSHAAKLAAFRPPARPLAQPCQPHHSYTPTCIHRRPRRRAPYSRMASPFAGLARFCLSRSRRSFSVGLRARGAGEGGEGCVEELSQHVLRERRGGGRKRTHTKPCASMRCNRRICEARGRTRGRVSLCPATSTFYSDHDVHARREAEEERDGAREGERGTTHLLDALCALDRLAHAVLLLARQEAAGLARRGRLGRLDARLERARAGGRDERRGGALGALGGGGEEGRVELGRVARGGLEQVLGVLSVAEGDALVVERAEVGEAVHEPVLVVVCGGDGRAADDEVLELAALGEGVAQGGEAVLVEGRVEEDEGAEVGEGGRDRGREGADGVVGEDELREAAEEGKVCELVDVVVGEVERVELVARDCEVLDGGDLVAAEVELALLERAQVGRSAGEEVCIEAVCGDVRRVRGREERGGGGGRGGTRATRGVGGCEGGAVGGRGSLPDHALVLCSAGRSRVEREREPTSSPPRRRPSLSRSLSPAQLSPRPACSCHGCRRLSSSCAPVHPSPTRSPHPR